ncbi:cytochrome c550 [Ornithinibacillus halotolerans]|uniref:Cytochrome c n=1 Tax=Ornithinibacillus halotolerans TaxID=1274357 RepID=A0A916RTQ1_9BACI|nr:cytochrome c [Ornithinibacillus halotolerans]GGA68550.1 cytochrome c [Ornithinibacillus halotolerans]
MKRNPIIPFAIIAVIGILATIVISFVGVNQRDEIAGGDEGQAEGQIMEDPEEIYAASCLSCHAADLSGAAGPALTTIGAELSLDEIKEVISNGKGIMPAFSNQLDPKEIDIISEWLSEKK